MHCENLGNGFHLCYTEGDVTEAPKPYYIMHCISADYALGAGVAKAIHEKFGTKIQLLMYNADSFGKWPTCHLTERVINLVTKECYFSKPTYDTLTAALYDAKLIMLRYSIAKIALPRIGCGLDRLKWDTVKLCLKMVFQDTDIEFLVYDLPKEVKKA